MIQYMDMTKAEGCFGVIPENGETIVFTGVSINSMPLSVKRKEGKYDIIDFEKTEEYQNLMEMMKKQV